MRVASFHLKIMLVLLDRETNVLNPVVSSSSEGGQTHLNIMIGLLDRETNV